MFSKFSHPTNNRLAFMASVLILGALILSAFMPAALVAPAEAAGPAVTPAPATSGEASLSVATDAKLGKILVGANGMTLYAFTLDGPNKSNCNADCLGYWPPLLTKGHPTLGAGVDASLVGSASLADGSKILTYNKMPLYFFVKDSKPGDASGQGFANQWYVVTAAGKTVDEDASSAAPAPAVTAAPVAATSAVTTTMTITEPTINIATAPKLGKFLVGDKGMTLYIFKKDAPDKSNCTTTKCLQLWHPVLTDGSPILGAGLNAALFGSAPLADGTKVLTINKMPLYYYTGDSKAGDTKGEGFASLWYVISPLGKIVPLPVVATQKPSYGGGYGGGGGGMGGGGNHY